MVAFAQNLGILQTRMEQSRDHMKITFDYFQIEKWILEQIVRAEKLDEKKGYLSSFHVSFLSYGPLIVQKNAFFAILCWSQQETQVC